VEDVENLCDWIKGGGFKPAALVKILEELGENP
jgi:hypothetical protein